MLPDNYQEVELGMTNCDHIIDEGFKDAIKNKAFFGYHSAWNFNGEVYWLNNSFHEDIWYYHLYQETISADSLEELMRKVNNKYGWK